LLGRRDFEIHVLSTLGFKKPPRSALRNGADYAQDGANVTEPKVPLWTLACRKSGLSEEGKNCVLRDAKLADASLPKLHSSKSPNSFAIAFSFVAFKRNYCATTIAVRISRALQSARHIARPIS
jgi:hypothetical protein